MRDVLARYRSALRVGAICLALLGAPAYAQTAPSASFRKLVSSNGFAPVVYDVEARRAVSFREHLYRYPRAGLETRELLYDLYLGLRTGSSSRWMTDVRIDQAGYVPGTGLIRTEQRVGGLLLSTTYFSPFELEFPAFVAIGRLENTGADTTDVALFSIHNFHLGGGADRARGESIRWDAQLGAYIESSAVADAAQGGLLIAPLGVATHHQASPMNPYGRLMAGQLFEDVDSSGVMDDAVSGFQFDVAGRGSFAAGAVSAAGLVAMYVPDRDFARAKRALDAWVAGRDPVALVTDAETEWQRWRDSGAIPASTDPAEARVATQALATLRMAQSREAGAPNGQIVASIAPGHWDITWLRDATYAIRALIETHHYPEAERALDFLVRGPFNTERARVGRDYGVSICRYYGSGAEETDFNGNGPNVELDGFGLYLDVASAYAKSSTSGAAWLRAHHGALASGIAEVLHRDGVFHVAVVAGRGRDFTLGEGNRCVGRQDEGRAAASSRGDEASDDSRTPRVKEDVLEHGRSIAHEVPSGEESTPRESPSAPRVREAWRGRAEIVDVELERARRQAARCSLLLIAAAPDGCVQQVLRELLEELEVLLLCMFRYVP